jgi:hypothetical protein
MSHAFDLEQLSLRHMTGLHNLRGYVLKPQEGIEAVSMLSFRDFK